MKVWSTWRCSLVGNFSILALRDCSVTDGHHGHELQDDSSCGLEEVKRALWLLMFFNKTCHNKTETKLLERPWWHCRKREQWQRQFDRLWSTCMTHTQPATTVRRVLSVQPCLQTTSFHKCTYCRFGWKASRNICLNLFMAPDARGLLPASTASGLQIRNCLEILLS